MDLIARGVGAEMTLSNVPDDDALARHFLQLKKTGDAAALVGVVKELLARGLEVEVLSTGAQTK